MTNPVWLVQLTNCLGSFAVSGGYAFTQTRRSIGGLSKEICVALSVTNGQELWATTVDDASYPQGGVGDDDGPRSTATVDAGSVFVLTSYLKLFRLDAVSGAVIWQKDLRALYGGNVIGYQNAASPLLENGLIFVNANCANSNLMALSAVDGTLVWRSQNEPMTHSTPVLASIQGVRQVIFASQKGLVSLDPGSGALLWRFSYPFTYSTSIGCSPVVYQDLVYVCGAQIYGMGSVVASVVFTNGLWTATQLWANTGITSTLSSHWMTPICYQGFLYGQFGVQSFDSVTAQLKCVEMRTGVVKWSASNFGRGAVLLARDRLVALTERGQLVLVNPNTNAYTELGRFQAIANWVMAGLSQRALKQMRQDLFRHLQTLPLSFFDRNPAGELMSRLTNDIDAINQAVSQNVTSLIASVLSMLGILVAMFVLDRWLALASLLANTPPGHNHSLSASLIPRVDSCWRLSLKDPSSHPSYQKIDMHRAKRTG